ncbi:hypothetical protein SLI_5772 [Streptomyces lividans 1326]|uniref:Uncharacterized protein n=1 Tax=Streptomyces lividans 1326 TaxID=1200984 RepID=A0A7U9DXW4_STRLI|nr:hypothetical protein SLI_5772 [Streptomyces lividans 1326]
MNTPACEGCHERAPGGCLNCGSLTGNTREAGKTGNGRPWCEQTAKNA